MSFEASLDQARQRQLWDEVNKLTRPYLRESSRPSNTNAANYALALVAQAELQLHRNNRTEAEQLLRQAITAYQQCIVSSSNCNYDLTTA